jgi:hypothetical protein
MRRAWPVAVLLLLAVTGRADAAAEGCLFLESGNTWTLDSDCTVDGSLVVPDGVTLDGAQHTIIAIDPLNGAFRGGIIVSGGASATVVNTVITAVMLTNVCQEGHERLRGIYFNGASGVIRGNTILNVNKGASACQEGNAIEVRNLDLSGRPTTVEIADNVVDGFQKSGVVVSGHVDATIRGNSIGPSAAQRLIVSNGIQAGAGARATIDLNTVAGNSWNAGDAAATAILLVNTAPGTLVRGNVIVGNADVGIYVMADGVRVERNRLTDTGSDGAFDVGIGNYGDGNVFENNSIRGYGQRYQNVTEPEIGNTTVAAR